MTPNDLATRARRAYELGRAARALRFSAMSLPAAAISFAACGQPPLHLALGAILFAATGYFAWRGGPFEKGIVPGFLSGAAPLFLPLLLRSAGTICLGSNCFSICLISCFGGGVLSGAAIAMRAGRLDEGRPQFVAAASTVAGLTGGLGCVLAGAGGVIGLAVGSVLAAAPVLALSRARS
jgi:hypothetical protein